MRKRNQTPDDLEELHERREPVDLEAVRSIDLLGCPACGVVFTVAGIRHVEHRRVVAHEESGGIFDRGDKTVTVERADEPGPDTISGIFCPSCGQRVHDPDSWTDHLADRKVWDREEAARKENATGGTLEPDRDPGQEEEAAA